MKDLPRRGSIIELHSDSVIAKTKKRSPKAIKKSSNTTMTEKFEIACLFGTNTIAYIKIDNNSGKLERKQDSNELNVYKLDIKARVIKLVDDKTHAFGMTLLTDDGPTGADFTHGGFDCLI